MKVSRWRVKRRVVEKGRDTHFTSTTEHATKREPTLGQSTRLNPPLLDMLCLRLCFLLRVLDGNIFACVRLEDGPHIRGLVNSDSYEKEKRKWGQCWLRREEGV